ncbi:MAG: hypothetical protein RI894_2235, partial [Bacteroidota bacterium]|jgi:hypothetical protein
MAFIFLACLTQLSSASARNELSCCTIDATELTTFKDSIDLNSSIPDFAAVNDQKAQVTSVSTWITMQLAANDLLQKS